MAISLPEHFVLHLLLGGAFILAVVLLNLYLESKATR
jgi:hypothetical protein